MIDFESLIFNEEGYADVIPSAVANTNMQARINSSQNGILLFRIRPVDGYVLHDNRADEEVFDPVGAPTGEVILRYATGMKSVGHDYDFDNIVPDTITDVNGNTIAVNKVGAYELFAVPASAVPEDNTYGGGNNEHEVM